MFPVRFLLADIASVPGYRFVQWLELVPKRGIEEFLGDFLLPCRPVTSISDLVRLQLRTFPYAEIPINCWSACTKTACSTPELRPDRGVNRTGQQPTSHPAPCPCSTPTTQHSHRDSNRPM
ncbi:hypothetical protein ACLOJK_029959 [Asimina triloba]